MTIDKIITLTLAVASFILTVAIPTIIVVRKKYKDLKEAKNAAERAAIISDILNNAQNFVVSAEELYKDVNNVLKANGFSCGKLKKDKVMTDIKQLCLAKGIAFDADFWSEKVEEIVAVTKSVNANK